MWRVNPLATTRREFVRTAAVTATLLPLGTLAQDPGAQALRKLNIVCVGGHPDDPETGCGGTLRKFSAAGHTVSAVYLTRGEAGIEGKSHQEAAKLRTAEAVRACKVLGATPVFFGQTDGATVFDAKAVDRMTSQLQALRPDLLLAHWPIDTHPDHQVASLLAVQARLRLGNSFDLYFYEVCTGAQSMTFQPTDYVDISSVQAAKREAVFCHASQDPDDIYGPGGHALMEQFRGLEYGVKAAEAFVRMTGRGTSAIV